MVEELHPLQAKGLIFLLNFAFFVEHHLLGNTNLNFFVLWSLQTKGLIFLIIIIILFILCWKSLTREHIIECVSLMVYESMQTEALTFLIIF